MAGGAKSALWRLSENFGAQFVQFAVQLWLTRLLMPTEFAVMAVLMVFISLGLVLGDGGLASALVQRREVGDLDSSTAFYLSLGVSLALYACLFLAAPHIAAFYERELLAPTMRVMGLALVIGAFSSVQMATAIRDFRFRELMLARLASQVVGGIVALIAAGAGHGIWALVWFNLVAGLTQCFVLGLSVRWRPRAQFSLGVARELFTYGWRVLLGGLVYTGYLGLYSVILGKSQNASLVGYFDRGRQVPSFVVNTFNKSVQAVSFPYFAQIQDSRDDLVRAMGRTLRLSAAISIPAALGLYAMSEPLVTLLLTEKWLPAAFFLRMWALYFLFSPIANVNQQAMKAIGRADIYLRCELMEVGVGVVLVFALLSFGENGIMVALVFSGLAGALIHGYPSGREFGLGIWQQVVSLWRVLVASIAMFAVVMWAGSGQMDPLVQVGVQGSLGVLVYVAVLECVRAREVREMITLFRSALGR